MSEDVNKSMKVRMAWVKIFIFTIGFAVAVKILHLVIFQRSLYSGTSSKCLDMTQTNWQENPLANDPNCNCFVKESSEIPERGKIFDDQGRILVANYTIFDITIDGRTLKPDTRKKKKKGEVDSLFCTASKTVVLADSIAIAKVIDELAVAFRQQFGTRFPEKSVEYYRARIGYALWNKKNSLIISSNDKETNRWITRDDTTQLAKLPLFNPKVINKNGCINYSIHNVRIMPYGDMAKRLLGDFNVTDKKQITNANGIEGAFNEELFGSAGSKKNVYVNKTKVPLERKSSFAGKDVHTTLNLQIQDVTHKELVKRLIKENADWGCAVIMETKTGEVKAYSNLTRIATGKYEELNNYAFKVMVEPGSTFKLASLLAYLEQTNDDQQKKYPILYHKFHYKGQDFIKFDEKGRSEASGTPIVAFQRSSNVGIASMIFDKYPNHEDYLKKLDSMFIVTSYQTQLGMLKAPEIANPSFRKRSANFHVKYNTCFGTGFKMTILQTLVYYNAVANNGKMIAPLFVKSVSDLYGNETTYQAEVLKEQICKPATITRAKQYLEAVVQGSQGTANRYHNNPVHFAGKTGTRDVWDENTKSYNHAKNSVSFCGYFPAENPQYTCIVYIHNVDKHSSIAVDLFVQIMNKITEKTVAKTEQDFAKGKTKKMPSFDNISYNDFIAISEGFGFNDFGNIPDVPYLSGKQQGNKFLLSEAPKAKFGTPSVKNMKATDAVQLLANAGYTVTIKNRGKVAEQIMDEKKKKVTLILN